MSNVQSARSERVALRLTPELKARIEALAEQDDVTLSKWLERAAREAADKRKPN
jgi:predicted HicB family RNase H-like nuclease